MSNYPAGVSIEHPQFDEAADLTDDWLRSLDWYSICSDLADTISDALLNDDDSRGSLWSGHAPSPTTLLFNVFLARSTVFAGQVELEALATALGIDHESYESYEYNYWNEGPDPDRYRDDY